MQSRNELVSQLQIEVRPLDPKDIEQLDPILRENVQNRLTGQVEEEEIANIKKYMAGAADEEGRTRQYVVARGTDGKVYGCMAISEPDADMKKHFQTDGQNEAELLNAFVSSALIPGGGVGRKLFNAVCDLARSQGKTALLINSGPRYAKSWGFYDKVTNGSRGFIIEKYGKGGDAKTWVKYLK